MPRVFHRGVRALLAAALVLATGCGGKSATAPAPAPPVQPGVWVSATTGLDTNDGTSAHPFKTLTHAMAVSPAGAEIHLMPGGYDEANGETFPLFPKAGQAILGDTLTRGGSGTSTIGIGGSGPLPGATPGSFPHDATIVAAAGCRVSGVHLGAAAIDAHFLVVSSHAGVTLTHDLLQGPAKGGVLIAGGGRCEIRNVEIGTTAYGVYLAASTDSVIVEDNDFVRADVPIDVVGASSRTIIRANHIGGTLTPALPVQAGIHVESGAPLILENVFDRHGGYAVYGAVRCWTADATPYLRGNVFADVVLGVRVDDGAPDLGTEADPGLNVFTGVAGAALTHLGGAALSAIGNTWQHAPPTHGGDIVVNGAGSVRWGAGTGEVYP